MDEDFVSGDLDSPRIAPAIEGCFSAAILLMLLEENDAASILQHLTPTEIKALGKGMFGAANAREPDVDLALENFIARNHELSALAVGAPMRIREMMHKALGNVRANNILAEIAPEASAPALDLLRWMDVGSITQLVISEHPQVAAVILSVLTPEVAAQAIAGLDETKQTDLLLRSARLRSIPAQAIADLEAVLGQFAGKKAQAPEMKLGGHNEVARIVNSLPRPVSEKLLRGLRKKDRSLADAIEDEMFVFGDLAALDGKTLGAILRNVEADRLCLAIKGTDQPLAEKMLGTLSSRAADTIRDEINEMGQVKRADVEDAQKEIIAIARQMAAAGEIVMGGNRDDYV